MRYWDGYLGYHTGDLAEHTQGFRLVRLQANSMTFLQMWFSHRLPNSIRKRIFSSSLPCETLWNVWSRVLRLLTARFSPSFYVVHLKCRYY
jgi:hypothetical protein